MLGEADPQPADSTSAMLEILARSMSQLQDMQARTLQKGLDDEAPEAVKSQVPALPVLAAPEGVTTGIVLQDWLAQIAIAMQDLSPSSGAWWSKVMDVVHNTYTRWLGSTPLERLQLQPQQYSALAEGKWMRVNARACSMLLQSFTDVVKQDMISRRIVQHATLILFRLHTMYQPGGASEKTLVLGNLQTPSTCASLDEALIWLRAWPRWIQRCQDLNMMCPDGTVLSRALTTVTSKFIAEGADAQFRTQLLRSTLRIDGQPSLDDVKRYHQHLQAELESAAAARTSTTLQQPKIQAAGVQGQGDKQQASTNSSNTTKAPCKYFFKPSGCRRGQNAPMAMTWELCLSLNAQGNVCSVEQKIIDSEIVPPRRLRLLPSLPLRQQVQAKAPQPRAQQDQRFRGWSRRVRPLLPTLLRLGWLPESRYGP